MKKTEVGNGQINVITLFMCLGLGIGAVLSLVLKEIIYMVIGMGIGSAIGLVIKIVQNKHKKPDRAE